MIQAGFKDRGAPEAARYIVQICLLADEMKVAPSVIHGTVKATDYRWTSRDRLLMLAFYQVKAKMQNK